MKILIVDNSQPMRKMIANVLEQSFPRKIKKQPIEFFECSDGANAPVVYRSIQPDWMFIDVSTNTAVGLEANAQIKQEFPSANIIVLTDYDTERFREKAKRAGVEHIILKENLTHIKEVLFENK